ncbi:MAG TPA: hypothetical protein VFZ66_04980 [Herpetosiphonaceae bacterium]
MPNKRSRRRAILEDLPELPEPQEGRSLGIAPDLSAELKLISFGSPRRPADRCTYFDAPAEFGLCLDCQYNRGAKGSGIVCAHRFGLDPTVVDGKTTQFTAGEIVPLDEGGASRRRTE